jgi:hypothetical protein
MYKLLVKTHEITLFLVIFEYLEAIPHPWLSAFTNPNLNQVPQAAGPVPRHLQERSFATLPSVERREHLWNFHIKNIKKNPGIFLYMLIYIYILYVLCVYIYVYYSPLICHICSILYIYDMCVWVCRCMYVLYKYIYIHAYRVCKFGEGCHRSFWWSAWRCGCWRSWASASASERSWGELPQGVTEDQWDTMRDFSKWWLNQQK